MYLLYFLESETKLSFFAKFENSIIKIAIPLTNTEDSVKSSKKEIQKQEIKNAIVEQLIASTSVSGLKHFDSGNISLRTTSMNEYVKLDDFHFDEINDNDVVYIQLTGKRNCRKI